MAKQKAAERLRLLSVRVPDRLYTKIDQFRVRMARDLPGSAPSVSDAVRVLIERSLESRHGEV